MRSSSRPIPGPRSIPGAGLVAALMAATLVLGSCSSKERVTDPDPVTAGVAVNGNVVTWTTDVSTRASVRYGFTSGDYSMVAYPAAANREDRALRKNHRVPLLSVQDGQDVFLQVLSTTSGGAVTASSEVQATIATSAKMSAPLLTSTLMHIGWGDAHIMTMPTSGKRVLIDSGDGNASRSVAEYFQSVGVTDLDVVAATHVHYDHIGGLVDGDSQFPPIIEAFDPEIFLDSPSKTHFRNAYGDALTIIAAENVERVIVNRFDTDQTQPALAWDPAVSVTILNSGLASDVPVKDFESDNINNESIVFKITYGDVDFIIGGDAEFEAEQSMLAAFDAADLNAEYFKAHHHGRNDGSSLAFLNAVKPRIAMLPVSTLEYNDGYEGYISDSSGALNRIASVGADIFVVNDIPALDIPYTSGWNHNMTFVTDGLSYEVHVERALQSTKVAHGAHDCDSGYDKHRDHEGHREGDQHDFEE